jgi:hypothetical protein
MIARKVHGKYQEIKRSERGGGIILKNVSKIIVVIDKRQRTFTTQSSNTEYMFEL